MRLLLEPFAAQNAAALIGDGGTEVEHCAARFWILRRATGTPRPYSRIKRQRTVHVAMARLRTHVRLFGLFYLPSATKDVNAEHAAIVDAVGEGLASCVQLDEISHCSAATTSRSG